MLSPMEYFVTKEVWSISLNDADRKLLRSSPPLLRGDRSTAEKLAEEISNQFAKHGYQCNATYPYRWGRSEGERKAIAVRRACTRMRSRMRP